MSNAKIRRQLSAGQGERLREPDSLHIERTGIYAPQPEPARMAPASPWDGVLAALDKLAARGIIK